MHYGQLQVEVYTSRGKIPISGASVLFYRGKEIFALEISNASGNSKKISIPTPAPVDSQAVGTAIPFTSVDILVEHPSFLSQTVENVQVFPETFSILPIELLPLAEEESSLVKQREFVLSEQNL